MATKAPAKVKSRKDLTGPALRTFFNIADAWGLSETGTDAASRSR